MKTFGIDFTSAPGKKKPITCAVGWLEGNELKIEAFYPQYSFQEYEDLLMTPGPWFMAIDFPFSLPLVWVQAMKWPTPWGDYVKLIGDMPLEEFLSHVRAYRQKQPKGQKYHFRPVDRLARSCSPMMIDYTPVGRMFYQGAPRLLKAGVCIPLLSIRNTDRMVVEGYPALVARRFIGKTSYKSDSPKKQTADKTLARRQVIQGITENRLIAEFGFKIDLSALDLEAIISEPGADSLDAILCCIQGAWAASRQEMDFGIPEVRGIGVGEGWIADPSLLPENYNFFEAVCLD